MNRSLRQEIAVKMTKKILKMKKQNKTNQNKSKQRNKNIQWLHRWPESNFLETFVRLP